MFIIQQTKDWIKHQNELNFLFLSIFRQMIQLIKQQL